MALVVLGAFGASLFVPPTALASRHPGQADQVGETSSRDATPAAQLWVARYDEPTAGDDYDNAAAIKLSPDGSTVFVTGSSIGQNSRQDYATVAYDASSGDQLWVMRYNGPGNSFDFAVAIGVSPDGSTVFVTGSSTGSDGLRHYATVAYDASTGRRLWVSRFRPESEVAALGVSPDGTKVFVTGTSLGSGNEQVYATVAYAASTGHRLWVSRYQSWGISNAHALGVSPDGSTVFVTGTSTAAQTGQDYATVAYRASSGRLLWAARSVGTCLPRACYYSNATALGVSPDGSTVFVTGTTIPPDSDQDYATVAYRASSGKQLWATRYAPGGFNNYANAISVSPVSSAVFVTGSSPTNGRRSDYATVAYDATTGQQLWVERYNGPANLDDDATAIAPSPDGSAVFVTGFSRGLATSDDYATVAYDAATGDQLWVERYDGPAHFPDWAFAIAVSPDGSAVFVTGQSWSGTDYDYATVAYGST